MTASDFLDAWTASPDSEMFIGVRYGQRPYAVGRLKAGDFGRVVVHGEFGQLEKLATDPNFLSRARVESVKGVTCLIIEGEGPALPKWAKPETFIKFVPDGKPFEPMDDPSNRDYRIIFAPADVFGA